MIADDFDCDFASLHVDDQLKLESRCHDFRRCYGSDEESLDESEVDWGSQQ